MKISDQKFLIGAAAAVMVAAPTLLLRAPAPQTPSPERAVVGDISTLKKSYDNWKQRFVKGGWDNKLVVQIGYEKALSRAHSRARGTAVLDLGDGSVSVEIAGLDTSSDYEVWLLDNVPGENRSILPEDGDTTMRLGALAFHAGKATLQANLPNNDSADFDIDQIVVVAAGDRPVDGLLFGSPSFFQRLYYSEKRDELAKFARNSQLGDSAAMEAAPFDFVVPGIAYASDEAKLDTILQEQLAFGEQLFFEETFDGNGRTCGTCHPAENNFTIDPAFISKLPDKDPLFVAEFKPELAELENPILLRELGLILANKDGFDAPGVFRSPLQLLGLPMTVTGETSTGFPFAQGVGWSGDGGVGNEIRGFGSGAVKQHNPKTLNRVAGVDFRLPTEAELDAMEAFMFSLGRQEEYILADLEFRSPLVEEGKLLFDDRDGPAKCKRCHDNGGSNSSSTFQNGQRNTGVEDLPQQPAWTLAEEYGFDMLCDGGFGTGDGTHTRVDTKQGLLVDACDKSCLGGIHTGGCGDGTFNVTSVIESADTAPFFHNNAVATLEGSVEFYNTDAFNQSPSAIGQGGIGIIDMDDYDVMAVSMFLRTINAVENIRSTTAYLNRALARSESEARKPQDAFKPQEDPFERLIRLALAEIEDGVQVLKGGQVVENEEAIERLKNAHRFLTLAKGLVHFDFGECIRCIIRALEELEAARNDLLIRG